MRHGGGPLEAWDPHPGPGGVRGGAGPEEVLASPLCAGAAVAYACAFAGSPPTDDRALVGLSQAVELVREAREHASARPARTLTPPRGPAGRAGGWFRPVPGGRGCGFPRGGYRGQRHRARR
ncbi:hypothetical protein SUDANB37_04905 [Streptomyces sp. enrichment culture]